LIHKAVVSQDTLLLWAAPLLLRH